MVVMKRYIGSARYQNYYTTDNLEDILNDIDTIYYTEYINKDKQVEGILKRTRMGGKSERLKLQYLFNLNSEYIKENINFKLIITERRF